jgi:hypothetical protein
MKGRYRSALIAIAFAGLNIKTASATVACGQLGYGSYTLKAGDTCAIIAGNPKLHFKNFAQIMTINAKLTKFSCSNTKKGQIICHPKK